MAGCAFILATEVRPAECSWANVLSQADALREFATRTLGFPAAVRVASVPTRPKDEAGEYRLELVIDGCATDDVSEIFVLPASFALNIWQRTLLGDELGTARRRHSSVSIHHDTADLGHPLLIDCLVEQILRAAHSLGINPAQAGLVLIADGQGDPGMRADSYRLMRVLWEHARVGRADVGFVRHEQPFLRDTLERCLAEPLQWLLLPQCQWDGELCEFSRVLLADHQRLHTSASRWRFVDPPGDHDAILAWLQQRLLRLWEDKRARQAAKVVSARTQSVALPAAVWNGEAWVPPVQGLPHAQAGILARANKKDHLAEILKLVLPPSDRYLVKVTWHGYAPGTFTGPAALDLLLSALPGRAILLEGHTSSRNLGGLEADWENGAREHRAWIRQQDLEFLRRTGLAEVIARHRAQYLNVTEAWWDELCAPSEVVEAALGHTTIANRALAGFVPAALLELRGTPLISFARLKGPLRLGLTNLFGLIPVPLRTVWHGANATDFAHVCCDLAAVYGALFPLLGLVESFETAVRWDRKGLYRSRWGNYDLVETEGVFTLSDGLIGADVLASRLQGLDVRRSGYYEVVRNRLGWRQEVEEMPLPLELQTSLV